MSDWPQEYTCAPALGAKSGSYRIRPIRWEDREAIRQWRNDQIYVLRQDCLLTIADQDRYFVSVVRPELMEEHPRQVLVGFLEEEQLVGYGGIVHIDWSDRRGEVSFLSDPSRNRLVEDWQVYLDMLLPCARLQLGLHKLTTETYDFRADVICALESRGFTREGFLLNHHFWDGQWHNSVLHGLLLEIP